MKLYHIFVRIICLRVVSSLISVKFFKDKNYVGLLRQFDATTGEATKCYNLHLFQIWEVSSAFLLGQCVILYNNFDCSGNSIKVTESVSDFGLLVGNSTNDNFDNSMASFRYCGNDEGTDNVIVDFFNELGYKTALTSYDNVCKCVTVPYSVLVNTTSIENHHNCIELFTTPDCKDDSSRVVLHAGRSTLSGNLKTSHIYSKIKSFKPCRIPISCIRLQATLYHFDIDADENDILTKSSQTSMSMSSKTTVWNNGPSKVTQEYIATREVREVLEVESIEWTKTTESWSKEKSTSANVNSILGGILRLNIAAGLDDNYSKTEESGSSYGEKHTYAVTTEFSARLKFELPPCSAYEAESFLTMVENLPVKYRAYARFNGTSGRQKMNSNQLRVAVEENGEFKFDKILDENTVSAYAEAEVLASFGVQTEIKGVGFRIPNCYYY